MAKQPHQASVVTSLYRLSVAQYDRMIEAGVLTEDDSTELIDGLLVNKMPKNPPHVQAVRRLLRALQRLTPSGWLVTKEEPHRHLGEE